MFAVRGAMKRLPKHPGTCVGQTVQSEPVKGESLRKLFKE